MFIVTLLFFILLKTDLKRRGGLIITVQKNATNVITQCLSGIKYIKLANIEDKVTGICRGNLLIQETNKMHIKTFLSKTPKVFLEFFSIIILLLYTLLIF